MKRSSILFSMLAIGLSVMFVFQSCTDLEEEIFSQVTEDQFFAEDAEFISALGAAYTGLYGYGGNWNMYALQEVTSDEMVVPTRGNDWNDGGKWRRLHLHTYNSEDPEIGGGWDFNFGGINACNRLIFQFTELNNPVATPFISELKVLRALYYLFLIDTYGNVPIVTDFTATELPSNSTRKEVFDFIESEVKASIGELSKATDASTYGRVNYYGAQAILAKLYINAEVYAGESRWADAAAACDEIINSGAYSLSPNFFDNFSADNSGSVENILVVPYDQVFAQGFNLPAMTLHYGSQETFNLTFQPWNGFTSFEEFYNTYEDDDVRKGSFIVGPQFKADGSPVLDSGYEADIDPDGEQLTFTPAINELGPRAMRQAGARVGKFEFANGATENLNNDFPIFRYGDILLLKAEALWHQDNGSADALDLVNMLRSRAGVEPFAALTADDLLAERGREMFAESWRRSDLIRFGKYLDEWWGKTQTADDVNNGELGRFDPEVQLFPIPRAQLDANKNLTQNPGY